jgi:hypothetical protein
MNLVCIILMIWKLRILQYMNGSTIKYQNLKEKDAASTMRAHKCMTVQFSGLAQTLQFWASSFCVPNMPVSLNYWLHFRCSRTFVNYYMMSDKRWCPRVNRTLGRVILLLMWLRGIMRRWGTTNVVLKRTDIDSLS